MEVYCDDLGGISQGAALAAHVGLTYPSKIGGVVLLSGWVPCRRTLKEVGPNLKSA